MILNSTQSKTIGSLLSRCESLLQQLIQIAQNQAWIFNQTSINQRIIQELDFKTVTTIGYSVMVNQRFFSVTCSAIRAANSLSFVCMLYKDLIRPCLGFISRVKLTARKSLAIFSFKKQLVLIMNLRAFMLSVVMIHGWTSSLVVIFINIESIFRIAQQSDGKFFLTMSHIQGFL